MNRNTTDPHALARELGDLRGSLSGHAAPDGPAPTDAPAALSLPEGGADAPDARIVARVVRGFSHEGWQEFCRAYPLSQWYALPVPDEVATGVRVADLRADPSCATRPGPGDVLLGALGSTMFAAQLERELLRLSRHGGGLSLVAAALAERRRLATALGDGTVARLERILGETLQGLLEACDSLGAQAPGRYILLLPGMGQLRTRRFAEAVQAAFAEAARPFFPTGGITAGSGASCALGVVHVRQERAPRGPDLLRRAGEALDAALAQDEGYIHQETSGSHGSTLVQSGEKRFLFFGGEPK
ncbi:MAG: GGDEF domain-containing protein [Desulfovibrio sp.]|nr:GGDEF domain-containing protein [Desulfovibrio sp.]